MTRSGSTSESRTPGRVAHDQEGVVAPAGQADGDQLGHPGAGAAGEQQHVGLVLDLVLPGQRQRRAGVLVPDEPPGLGEQAGVGAVAAHDLDRQLGVRPRRVAGAAPVLLGGEAQAGRVDAEVAQRVGHLSGGRRRRRGAEAQVGDRGRAPREHEAGDHRAREALGEQRGGRQRAEPERRLEQAAGGAGQVRPRGPQPAAPAASSTTGKSGVWPWSARAASDNDSGTSTTAESRAPTAHATPAATSWVASRP